MSALLIGSHIARYIVQRLLGQGGMGSVYLVEHTELRTRKAIKVLLPHLSRNPHVVQRFRNEARAAAATRSPNIVAVHDFGQLEDGSWYLVMDYWDGQTLAALMAGRGALPHDFIVKTALEALNGLAAAHKRNIIHRDLKPDNLYLAEADNDTRAMILDFGVCRLGEDAGGIVTRTGFPIGTPRYMAPEQFRGERIDHRADLWAIGATIYQMTTGGWAPYDVDDGPPGMVGDDQALLARMSYAPIDPRRRTTGVSPQLADVIMTMLDPDPNRRPATAASCGQLLANTLPGGLALLQARAPELARELGVEHVTPEVVPSLASPASSSPPSDDAAAPRYVIRSKIGGGGMAEVFRADTLGVEGFQRAVALKRVLPGFSEMSEFSMLFVEEARIASRLSHPNCVSVLDFDRDPEGRLFLVMEYIAGKDLAAVLQHGRLPPSVAIFLAAEALRGLEYAHRLVVPSEGIRGVVHRDISPHNIMISWDGAVKVADFGIAKALRASGPVTGRFAGKPAYMSPEQADGKQLDGRSDLFAVGIVLWEALTGTRLFQNNSVKETIGQLLFRDADPPSKVCTGIPADVDRVVLKLLSRDRDTRYAAANEPIEALTNCRVFPRNGPRELVRVLEQRFPAEVDARSRGHSTSDHTLFPRNGQAVASASPQSTLTSAASQPMSPRLVTPRRATRSRRWAIGAIAAVLTAIVVVLASPHRDDPAGPPHLGGEVERRTAAASAVTAVAQAAPGGVVPPNDVAVATSDAGVQRGASSPAPDASPRDAGLIASATSATPPDGGSSMLTSSTRATGTGTVSSTAAAPAVAGVHAAVSDASTADAGVVATATASPTRGTRVVADAPSAETRLGAEPRPPRAPPQQLMGRLSVYVAPFAQVWIDDAKEPIGETPLHLPLRVGTHRVHLGRKSEKKKTIVVTITAGKKTVIDEAW